MDDLDERVYSFLSEVSASDLFALIRLLAKELYMDEGVMTAKLMKVWDILQEKKAIESGYRVVHGIDEG